VFSLLTGYCDAPAGVVVADGMHYNPYFSGELTGMAQSLFNEVVEYEDGTHCSFFSLSVCAGVHAVSMTCVFYTYNMYMLS